ncbi:MAG: DDE-type integrase/transposase/recombinase [Chloroflexota bacterium]|nr:DDE-type integrase/transposase/recombinase [Chloroflexota bacterium]
MTRIHELLGERGCAVSYNSLRRFIQRRGWRRRLVTMRLAESAPGEVAELDFGRLGLVPDPESERRRTVWALIVVLRYSRRCFVWPTTSQKLDAVLEGLEAAWAFFEGVPRHLVLDIFPAAVAGADRLHPRLTRGLPRVRPAARPDRRPDASAPAARQAAGRTQRALRARALLHTSKTATVTVADDDDDPPVAIQPVTPVLSDCSGLPTLSISSPNGVRGDTWVEFEVSLSCKPSSSKSVLLSVVRSHSDDLIFSSLSSSEPSTTVRVAVRSSNELGLALHWSSGLANDKAQGDVQFSD